MIVKFGNKKVNWNMNKKLNRKLVKLNKLMQVQLKSQILI